VIQIIVHNEFSLKIGYFYTNFTTYLIVFKYDIISNASFYNLYYNCFKYQTLSVI